VNRVHSIPVKEWQKSKLDQFYRRFIPQNPFYAEGLAENAEVLRAYKWYFDNIFSQRAVFNRDLAPLVRDTKVEVMGVKRSSDFTQIRAQFNSPLSSLVALYPESTPIVDNLPVETSKAYLELVFPNNSFSKVCIQYPGTGDHGFKKRRANFAKPLIDTYNMGSVIYENAYYGKRKPPKQNRSALRYACDLVAIGGFVGSETPIIQKFLMDEFGLDNVGLTGVSFGGHLACIAACLQERPVPLVPAMSWTSSSIVWTEGLMTETMAWDGLKNYLESNPEISDIQSEMAEKLESTMYSMPGVERWSGPSKDYQSYERTMQTMRNFTDYFSGFPMMPTPESPGLTRFVVCAKDAYYPQISTVPGAEQCWPGIQVDVFEKYGHVEGYLFGVEIFGSALDEVLDQNSASHFKQGSCDITKWAGKVSQDTPDDLWVDNKVKLMAALDPVVVAIVKLARIVLRYVYR